MGLKIAQFQYTDRFGTVQNALLTWSGADINYGRNGSIRFAVYENAEEYARLNLKELFVMPITAEDVQSMFERIGNVALEISDASWEMAQERKFITSRTLDENNNPVFDRYSLTDLNAEIIDVGDLSKLGK